MISSVVRSTNSTRHRSSSKSPELVARHVVEEPGLVPKEAGHHTTVAARLERRGPLQDLPQAVLHVAFVYPVVVIRGDEFEVPGEHASKRALKRGKIGPQNRLVRQPAHV